MLRKKLNTLYRIASIKIFGTCPGYPVQKPLQAYGVEILADAEFQKSCAEAAPWTGLDTPRLANLWNFCRMTNPLGNIMEIGSFRGGGALHLSNSSPHRKIIICDSFESFEQLDPKLDKSFTYNQFKKTSREAVEQLFVNAGKKDYAIFAGFFPAVCHEKGLDPGRVSFVHLDVDAYKPTIESLNYLDPFMLEHSLIVLDDYYRKADGVMRAVREFTDTHRSWLALPLFPGQGLLVHKSWFD